MSSSQLTSFDAETIEEINSELVGRKIELMNVVNVETHHPPGDNEKEYPKFRVWYWYISELIK